MKKTSKPATSPAPATSRAVPAPGPAKKPATAAKSATAAPQTARAPSAKSSPKADAVKPTPRSLPASAVAVITETPTGTIITAEVDVGFGNTLYLRGEGPGLSWNKGLPLTNDGAARWSISLPRSSRPITFKFLLNDEIWSTGEDYSAEPGIAVVLAPAF